MSSQEEFEEEEPIAEGSVVGKSKLYLPKRIKDMLWLESGDKVEYVLDKRNKRIYIRKKSE